MITSEVLSVSSIVFELVRTRAAAVILPTRQEHSVIRRMCSSTGEIPQSNEGLACQ